MSPHKGLCILVGVWVAFQWMAGSATAQNESDVFRYTWLMPTGTARYTALGGAMGALGGDLSVVLSNPAGLGIYRKSQTAMGFGISTSHTRSLYYGSESRENRTSVNLPTIGFVGVKELRRKDRYLTGWQFAHFALTYNRTGDFNYRARLRGVNPESSLITYFKYNANQMGPPGSLDPFYEELLFRAQVLLYDTLTGQYMDFIQPWPHTNKLQDFYYNTWGNTGELGLNFAANYANRLYLGGGLNFILGQYRQFVRQQESDPMDLTPEFKDFILEQRLQTSLSGINLRVGAIVRPTDWVRLGVAFHSPCWLWLRDRYSNRVAASYDNSGSTGWLDSPFGAFNYGITTPLKLHASVGFTVQKLVALGLDYEFTDLSRARFRSGFFFMPTNEIIRSSFNTRHTVRTGLELKLDPLYLRGGFQYYSNGYQPHLNTMQTWSASGGLAFRLKRWTIDGAYVLYRVKPQISPYPSQALNPLEPARVVHHLHAVVLGFSFNF
ncbi:MAG: outer membrane protein transport protein [Flavobacteriales bacterium]|nr:outer membrane protein transport protein [Flavobacteriales bacterium]